MSGVPKSFPALLDGLVSKLQGVGPMSPKIVGPLLQMLAGIFEGPDRRMDLRMRVPPLTAQRAG